MTFSAKLYNPQQAEVIWREIFPKVKAYLMGGNKLSLQIKKENKSRDQEEKYHAMIGEISKQASHLGSKWDENDWKRLLLDKFARETGRTPGKLISNLDMTGIVEVGIQSRKFTVSDAGEFIEWLHAWGADNGVTFNEA
jgi:hypothetical protein